MRNFMGSNAMEWTHMLMIGTKSIIHGQPNLVHKTNYIADTTSTERGATVPTKGMPDIAWTGNHFQFDSFLSHLET